MLIILEGPDCAGKSTFAQRLATALRRAEPNSKIDVWHRGIPRWHPFEEYIYPLLDYRPEQNRHVICDRWHLGEVVYPSIVGRSTEQTPAVTAYIEMFLQSRGALLVHCTASNDHLDYCGSAREDAQEVRDLIPATTVSFFNAVTRSLLPSVTFDVSQPDNQNIPDYVKQVIGLGNDEAWFTEDLNPFTTYIGSPRPLVLFLGDRRGTAKHDVSEFGKWPAFLPESRTSGKYLMETLTTIELRVMLHGLTLREIGIANACDIDDPVALWHAIDEPQVVALGRKATDVCRDNNIPYRTVHHPQRRQRFHYNDRLGYLAELLGKQSLETA